MCVLSPVDLNNDLSDSHGLQVGVPRSQLAELEAALVHPTGVDTIPPPPLRLKGAMISPGCGVIGVFGERGMSGNAFIVKMIAELYLR